MTTTPHDTALLLRDLLLQLLPQLGQPPSVLLEPADDEDAWLLKVGEGFCEVEVHRETEGSSIWVYYWHTYPATRINPPEHAEQHIYGGTSPLAALQAIGHLYADTAAQHVWEGSKYGNEEG